jgi:hypothetical protein
MQAMHNRADTATKPRKSTNTKTTEERVMIVDDNFTGIVMLALVAVIYLAYKVGEYVGEMKK